MARGSNQKGSGKSVAPPAPGGEAPQAEIPTFKLWFEEAWHGWLKPVGGILLLVGAYFAYEYKIVPEGPAGFLVVGLIVGGALFSAAEPAWERLESRRAKYLMGAFLAVWAFVAGYPALHSVVPSATLRDVRVAENKDHLSETVSLPDDARGPYELEIGGNLKGQGEAESSYTLTFAGEGGTSEEVNGKIQRTFFRQRVSRRSSGSVSVKQERNENAHRLTKVTGPKITITADGADEQLEDGLWVTFHKAGPSPFALLGIGFLCFLIGVWLDYRLLVPKKPRTYFAMATGFTLVFALYYPMEATPHRLVPPAVAALILALITGGVVGWLVSVIANSFKPKPKKLAGAKA
jgi:hypothetical protein